MAKIQQKFNVRHPRAVVWDTMQDIPLVVSCVPGASLDGPVVEDKAKGRVTVKLGPVKADFGGEATIAMDPSAFAGKIAGVGMDKSHASRAKGDVTYHLESPSPDVTTVVVEVEYTLSGSLAQVARGGIVEAVAEQICMDFAANLEAEIQANAEAAPVEASPVGGPAEQAVERPVARRAQSRELNMVQIIWRMLRRKLGRMFCRA